MHMHGLPEVPDKFPRKPVMTCHNAHMEDAKKCCRCMWLACEGTTAALFGSMRCAGTLALASHTSYDAMLTGLPVDLVSSLRSSLHILTVESRTQAWNVSPVLSWAEVQLVCFDPFPVTHRQSQATPFARFRL